MTPSFVIRSSSDIIAAVPFVLGFHPADSLVTVGLHGSRIIFAARYDLPSADLAEDQARHLAALIEDQGINGATLIGYGAEARVTPAIRHAAEEIRRLGMTVRDVLRVNEGQFWSDLCEDEGCCPKPCPPADSAIAVAATVEGQVALPDREALVAQLAPVVGAERAAMTAATARAQGRLTDEFGADLRGDDFARVLRRAGRRAVRDAERRYRSGRRLTDDEAAWLGVMLLDLEVRDYAWERTGEEDWRISLWRDVLRRVEPGYVPAAAGLLSFAAWRQGSGALGRIAVDRALAHDPEYRMAVHMEEVLNLGLSPANVRDWPAVDRSAFDPASAGVSTGQREDGPGRGNPTENEPRDERRARVGSGGGGLARVGSGRGGLARVGSGRAGPAKADSGEGEPRAGSVGRGPAKMGSGEGEPAEIGSNDEGRAKGGSGDGGPEGSGRARPGDGKRPQLRQAGTGERAAGRGRQRGAHRKPRRRSV
jgi:hypothetical protein